MKLAITALLGSLILAGCAGQTDKKTDGTTSATASKAASADKTASTSKSDGAGGVSKSDKAAKENEHQPFPDFTLTDYNGKTLTKADFAGRKVVFKFWASWCHVCNQTREESAALANEADKGFTYISVIAPGFSGELATEEAFKEWYAKQEHNDLPVYFDKDGALMSTLGVRAFPSIATMNSAGQLIHFQAGHVGSAVIRDAMEKIK